MVTTKDSSYTGSLVAGLFYQDSDAHGAISELTSAGFGADAIQEFGHHPDTTERKREGGFMHALTTFFTGEPEQSTVASSDATITISELVSMGLSQEDASSLHRGLAEGDVLVIVHAGNRGADALEILKRNNASSAVIEIDGAPTLAATDISAEATAPDSVAADVPARAVSPALPTKSASELSAEAALPTKSGTQRIELLKEVLRVNKERVQRGEVRLRKEVVSETQTVEVPTTREELVIERHPVAEGQPVNATIGEGQEVRVVLEEDRVTSEKRAVVAEEVTVGKREVQGSEQVSETVRREELLTEREGDVVVEGDTLKDERRDHPRPL